ncbi:YdcF family protein [Fundidesulfovibrio terrae]|uniref:YdcF family protein n=1 Tax=Fundidesulfovibrio terrae TaxID=2922866 RepID=UPI001FAE7EAD|nr:ElyC/SanA/YdcF family protein [Fundidesulfovibrio terrae]
MLLKKILSFFLFPFSLMVLALALGVAMSFVPRRARAGRMLCLAGLVLLLAQSMPVFSNEILRRLEYEYKPILTQADIPQGVKWVVVLSSYAASDDRTPLTSQNYDATMHRLVEGVLLLKRIPGAKLLISGGVLDGQVAAAEIMAKLARELGVPEGEIVLETKSLDTEDQAVAVAKMVNGEKMLLVTSAVHMPRSMLLFRKYGMDPVAAPTHFTSSGAPFSFTMFLPTPYGMEKSYECAHELLGIAWVYLKGLGR